MGVTIASRGLLRLSADHPETGAGRMPSHFAALHVPISFKYQVKVTVGLLDRLVVPLLATPSSTSMIKGMFP